MSWTSSLLFALQLIAYRNGASEDQLSNLETIKLCVIDTTKFPNGGKGVFLRDLDLIEAFAPFDDTRKDNLTDFLHLRQGGKYYFGEYLSQGSLKVEGNIRVVSAQDLLNKGMHRLRPDLNLHVGRTSAVSYKDNKLANEVVRMRSQFHDGMAAPLSQLEVYAVISIAKLFGGAWRAPIDANFMALKPRRQDDEKLLALMVEEHFEGKSRRKTTTKAVPDLYR